MFTGDEAMMHALFGNHILEVVPQTFNGSRGEKYDALYVGDLRPEGNTEEPEHCIRETPEKYWLSNDGLGLDDAGAIALADALDQAINTDALRYEDALSSAGRSPILTKAIRHAIDEARLAYEFVPDSYTASALNACIAVEQAYLEATGRVSTITTPLAGSDRTSCMPMEFIEASSDRARVHHDTNTTTKPNQREGITNDEHQHQ